MSPLPTPARPGRNRGVYGFAMRVGDLTTEMIGKSITVRDSDDGKSSPAWLLRGQLVGSSTGWSQTLLTR